MGIPVLGHEGRQQEHLFFLFFTLLGVKGGVSLNQLAAAEMFLASHLRTIKMSSPGALWVTP